MWCSTPTHPISSSPRSVPSALPGTEQEHVYPGAEGHQLLHNPLPPTHGIGVEGDNRQMQAPIGPTGSSWYVGAPIHQGGLPFALALNHTQLPFAFAHLADPKTQHFRLSMRCRTNCLPRLYHQLLHLHTGQPYHRSHVLLYVAILLLDQTVTGATMHEARKLLRAKIQSVLEVKSILQNLCKNSPNWQAIWIINTKLYLILFDASRYLLIHILFIKAEKQKSKSSRWSNNPNNYHLIVK